MFSGDDAFELVTTHGFPRELIAEMAQAEGLRVDDAQFTSRWEAHTRISASKQIEVFTATALQTAKPRLGATTFTGYTRLELATELTLLEVEGAEVSSAGTGAPVRFALRETPFYAESGGQINDTGVVSGDGFEIVVSDVQKDEGLFIHSGTVRSGIAQPGLVRAVVDAGRRAATTRHHSATHLLHAALSQLVGDHIEQQGSAVGPEQLRFDFNNPGALTKDQLAAVEQWVNAQIRAGHPVEVRELPIDQARTIGAKAQFGEKYGSLVRVVSMGPATPVSVEFCGGCHVSDTADINRFRILREEACAAGVRRITAVAGTAAAALEEESLELARTCGRHLGVLDVDDPGVVDELCRVFKAQPKELPSRVEALVREVYQLAGGARYVHATMSGGLIERVALMQAEAKRLRKQAEEKAVENAAGQADELLAQIVDVAGVPFLSARLDGLDGKGARTLAETLRGRRSNLCLVLAAVSGDQVSLVASVSTDLQRHGLKAGDLVKALAPLVAGKGGGNPDLAQAGGKDPAGVAGALTAAAALVRQTVASAGGAA